MVCWPRVMLAVSYVRGGQATIDFARHELAGVAIVVQTEPWLIEVHKQRPICSTHFSW